MIEVAVTVEHHFGDAGGEGFLCDILTNDGGFSALGNLLVTDVCNCGRG